MTKIKIGINGFGRIGRCFFRAAFDNADVEIVGINDLGKLECLSHLLKYDSIHGTYNNEVSCSEGQLTVNTAAIPVTQSRDPREIPWTKWGADIVIESKSI